VLIEVLLDLGGIEAELAHQARLHQCSGTPYRGEARFNDLLRGESIARLAGVPVVVATSRDQTEVSVRERALVREARDFA